MPASYFRDIYETRALFCFVIGEEFIMSHNTPTIAKELSWLAFNERVLQEAANSKVPVIERVHYLGIFSNNLDEFFRVRVADVGRLAAFTSANQKANYNELLEKIQHCVIKLQEKFDLISSDVMRALQKEKIYVIHENQAEPHQAIFILQYFTQHIWPLLSPILLDQQLNVPSFNDGSIYFAIKLTLNDESIRYAILEIPSEKLDRFIEIPSRKKRRERVFMTLDNIIRLCIDDVFEGVLPIALAQAYTFKITRDAELEVESDISESFLDKMSRSLKKRKQADPVRLVYDAEMPADMLDVLVRKLALGRYDTVMAGGRYHNAKDFMRFPDVKKKTLAYKSMINIPVPLIEGADNVFSAIRHRDILLYYPYHSFNSIVKLLRTSAIDPQVREIKISLYRVASKSQIVDALINAAENGKKVTAVIELQARFDELANIKWAQRLTDSKVNVILSSPGLKVHAKAILISRLEGSTMRYYSHVGTGNFNEKTARYYTDFSLLTFNQEIGRDLAGVFDFLRHNYVRNEYQHLLVSPHSTRGTIIDLIDNEIAGASIGKKASIQIKCNNLTDEEVIAKLYEASQAGVVIKLIVRGMCSLVPQLHGISNNIEVISIVDRFLEHTRFYRFHNGGVPRYYISSADLMERNLDFRVEISCPIYDKALQKLMDTIFKTQWQDNVKARIIDNHLSNKMRPSAKTSIRSQEVLHGIMSKFTKKHYDL
jgi:polyphosphate kinase